MDNWKDIAKWELNNWLEWTKWINETDDWPEIKRNDWINWKIGQNIRQQELTK
jgi:hypothetical protein